MKLTLSTFKTHLEPMNTYLSPGTYIDSDHPEVAQKAAGLADGCVSKDDIVKRCFEFVRDEIAHSRDHQHSVVTCKASDVLREGTGYCYAKSHLLAALLR